MRWPGNARKDDGVAQSLAEIAARNEARYNSLLCHIGEAALAARQWASPAFRDLWDAELRVFSQWGEDGILDFLCDRLDLARPCALELGAGDFGECNTRFLAEHRHAAVVAVDVHDHLVSSARTLDLYWKDSIFPIEEWITPANSAQLMEKARELMGRVDVVSLDIDGNDYWVAEPLDLSETKIVVVEYNAVFGHRRAVTVPRDDLFDRAKAHTSRLYYGASLRAWIHLLGLQGFTFIGTNRACSNAFFCPTVSLERIPVHIPRFEELDRYMDCRVRESCDEKGHFTYLAGRDRLEAIEHLPVFDLIENRTISLAEAQEPYGREGYGYDKAAA